MPEPAPRTGILSNPSPTQVSRRQARPAPSPNTHSRSTTTRATRPPSSPVPLSAHPNVKLATQALSGPVAGVRGPGRHQRLTPSSAERTTERKSRRSDSQADDRDSPGGPQSWTPAIPAPGLPESPSAHLGSPTIPLGDNGGWGWAPQAGLRMLGPALFQTGYPASSSQNPV